MRQHHGKDMTGDNDQRLTQPDHPHCLAVIEKSGGYIKPVATKQIGPCVEGIIKRQQHILPVNEKRGQVMCGMIGKRGRKGF